MVFARGRAWVFVALFQAGFTLWKVQLLNVMGGINLVAGTTVLNLFLLVREFVEGLPICIVLVYLIGVNVEVTEFNVPAVSFFRVKVAYFFG